MDESNKNKTNKIYVLSSGDAQVNFIKELQKKECNGDVYISSEEREMLSKLRIENKEEYHRKKKELVARIKKTNRGGIYKFMGFMLFQRRTIGKVVKDGKKKKLHRKKGKKSNKKYVDQYVRKIKEPIIENLNNCILIVDEAHLIIDNDFGLAIETIIKKSKNLHVIFLTATPMEHKALEIIPLLNMLRPNDSQIRYNDIFQKSDKEDSEDSEDKEDKENSEDIEDKEDKFKNKKYSYIPSGWKPGSYELTKNGIKLLQLNSIGYISYLRGINPITFPKRIEMGKVIKSKNKYYKCKYTKLIRCEMSPFHYRTYKKFYKNTLGPNMTNLINMVFPDPESKSIGMFKSHNIREKYSNPSISKKWLKEHKIEIVKIDKEDISINGNILKKQNLKKYSTKFVKILDNLDSSIYDNVGIQFVYFETVRGIGAKLFGNILSKKWLFRI